MSDVDVSVAATNTGLIYDPASGRYHFNWKTEKAWKGTGRLLTMTLDDGSTHTVTFLFR